MFADFRRCALGVGLSLTLAGGLAAQTPDQRPAGDNTKVNVRDRKAGAKTADQQSQAKSDVETTRQIRRAIVADKQLSTNAHNVKIITKAGKVTIKGPVKTDDEKKAVEAKAREVAGAANVTSQISVTDGSPKSDKTSAQTRNRKGR
jgi:hyperosmotically inducible periplasmic protein